jgi:hypothetical protein
MDLAAVREPLQEMLEVEAPLVIEARVLAMAPVMVTGPLVMLLSTELLSPDEQVRVVDQNQALPHRLSSRHSSGNAAVAPGVAYPGEKESQSFVPVRATNVQLDPRRASARGAGNLYLS